MDLPKVLLIGTIYCASSEWNDLSDIAELVHLKDGNRDTFRNGCHSGHYDGVVVIIRCEDAYKVREPAFSADMGLRKYYTGRFDTDLIQSLPKSVKFICAPQVGQWRGHAGLGHDPEGKVLGIVGMGNIGSVVAKRAAAFDMHIQYCNRTPLPVERTPPGTKYVSFEDLLRTSDIISVYLPLSDDSGYTLGSNEFAQVKDGVILINTSRGPIIDEQALVDALESGKLYSAGLDAFENEPQVHPKLLANENVVLTPHMAAGTVETIHKSEALAMSNVRNALQHGTLLTQVREQRAE
ncbi:hypothetical protein BPAE_0331g00030 [Botrytis paeoniae]|uniref:D-isomer specific 2-hydroxyacid dehydrogenase NAD-binding domain-containing protein n=1 Tax=Botrytis paeoniae TaxID=278948 RepID=A0A4Z1FA61_9HELO|nr:hypothetical protein BPAE_0331g00030 [Botrytis paeoniae]